MSRKKRRTWNMINARIKGKCCAGRARLGAGIHVNWTGRSSEHFILDSKMWECQIDNREDKIKFFKRLFHKIYGWKD